MTRRAVAPMLLVALLGWAAWPWMPGVRRTPPRTLVVYGFSVLGDTMRSHVFLAFREEWRRRTGEDVEIVASFAGSGTITNQVILGVPAEVALLSTELDAQRLADAGAVQPGSWRALPHGGVLNRTPFVILVRPGNPKRVASFADLARPGVSIVHPDPRTSGGATWAILAEYGAAERAEPGSGRAALRATWSNVTALAPSARAARTQFDNGYGDALVTYEQDGLAARRKGSADEIVMPPSTVLSEHLVVVVDRNVPARDRELVAAFVAWLWSPQAQQLMAADGFRSVLDDVRGDFAPLPDAFTVADFGGWTRAKADVVDGQWKRVMAELRR